MYEKELPARPNLEQYKKQAKELVRDCELGIADALARIKRNHPRFHSLPESEIKDGRLALSDAQLVIAREHGFESWPQFSKHIEMIHMIQAVSDLSDPVSAFIEVACVPRHTGHASGTLEHAEMILQRYPQVAKSNIHTAAILADEAGVREFLARNPKGATAKGDPHEWDALTHLCFSRYLRIDASRSEAFVRTARCLLEAGASANTGWYETIDQPNPRPCLESAIYGAAGVAHHAELTRLLLEYGAEPNDEESPYHVPEGYDNATMKVLLESGKLNEVSLSWMLLRKIDWHDGEGIRMLLESGVNPNVMTNFGDNALHHAIRRDNSLEIIQLLLDHGADPSLKTTRENISAAAMAAHKGRGDMLRLLERRGIALNLEGPFRLIAACAKGEREEVRALAAQEPQWVQLVLQFGGTLLSGFAGNGNLEGIRCLLDLGVDVDAPDRLGDTTFDVAKDSTALQVAAWRARPAVVKELIARGAAVNALDGKGRSALLLAIKACVNSYWTERRTTESIEDLLQAGASWEGIAVPTGYEEADKLLRQYSR
jgi:ankyrin repeat protein